MNLEEAFLLIETDIVLNDFFHRYPELAPQRNVAENKLEALQKWRADVHKALENLSTIKGIKVAITQATVLRMVSLFGEYFVPPTVSRAEVLYLLNNYKVLQIEPKHIENALNTHLSLYPAGVDEEQTATPDGASLHQLINVELAKEHQIGYILSAAHQMGDYLQSEQAGELKTIALLHPAQILALP